VKENEGQNEKQTGSGGIIEQSELPGKNRNFQSER